MADYTGAHEQVKAKYAAMNTKKSSSTPWSSSFIISSGGATNPVTGTTTAKSSDTIALETLQKELSFNRVKDQIAEEDASKLRAERRKAAVASADFQRRAQGLEIETRQAGLGREMAALKRQARQTQAAVLSGAAGAGNIFSSSSQAAQIATRSNLQRELGYGASTEERAKRADALREEQIAAQLAAALLNETDPTKVVQDASGQIFVNGQLYKAKQEGEGITGFINSDSQSQPNAKADFERRKKIVMSQIQMARKNYGNVKFSMPSQATLEKYGLENYRP